MAVTGRGGVSLEFFGGKNKRKFNLRARLFVVVTGFSLLAILLMGRALYLATSDAHRGRTNLIVMTRVPQSLGRLEVQNQKIAKIADDIDSFTLKEIKQVLGETSRIAERAKFELRAQADAWEKIKTKINVDASTYYGVQRDLAEIGALQSEQMIRLNRILDESSRPTLWESASYYFWSFVLGVISSLAATILVKKFIYWRSGRISEPDLQ